MQRNTGMRKGEISGLTWDRVDFARCGLLLERTKSGRRREVPMNRAVYDVLAPLHGDRMSGRVFGGAPQCTRSVPERRGARRARGFQVSRPAPHVRVVARDARAAPQGSAGAPRPPDDRYDDALRPSVAGSAPRCRGFARRFQHNVSTKRRFAARRARKSSPELATDLRSQPLVEQQLAVALRQVVDVTGGMKTERRVHLNGHRVGLVG